MVARAFPATSSSPPSATNLIVDTDRHVVLHHRLEGEAITVAILYARQGGTLALDPPGITVAVADFFADLPLPNNA